MFTWFYNGFFLIFSFLKTLLSYQIWTNTYIYNEMYSNTFFKFAIIFGNKIAKHRQFFLLCHRMGTKVISVTFFVYNIFRCLGIFYNFSPSFQTPSDVPREINFNIFFPSIFINLKKNRMILSFLLPYNNNIHYLRLWSTQSDQKLASSKLSSETSIVDFIIFFFRMYSKYRCNIFCLAKNIYLHPSSYRLRRFRENIIENSIYLYNIIYYRMDL